MKILEPNFVYCTARKNAALTMLYFLLVLGVLAMFSGLFRVTFEIWLNDLDIKQLLLERNIYLYLELLQETKTVSFFTGICFIIWFIRVYRNHQALTKTNNKTVSFRSFFLFFWRITTFLSFRLFWRTYEIANELLLGKNYIVSQHLQEVKDETQVIKPLAIFWWASICFHIHYSGTSTTLWERLQNELPALYELPILHMAIVATLLADICLVLACILSIKRVKGIHSRQTEAHKIFLSNVNQLTKKCI